MKVEGASVNNPHTIRNMWNAKSATKIIVSDKKKEVILFHVIKLLVN